MSNVAQWRHLGGKIIAAGYEIDLTDAVIRNSIGDQMRMELSGVVVRRAEPRDEPLIVRLAKGIVAMCEDRPYDGPYG